MWLEARTMQSVLSSTCKTQLLKKTPGFFPLSKPLSCSCPFKMYRSVLWGKSQENECRLQNDGANDSPKQPRLRVRLTQERVCLCLTGTRILGLENVILKSRFKVCEVVKNLKMHLWMERFSQLSKQFSFITRGKLLILPSVSPNQC